jgi:hypothetical protein
MASDGLAQAARGRRGGRNGSQPVYNDVLADEICDRLAAGESLSAICKHPQMPDEKTVRLWATEGSEWALTFAPKYTRARQIGYERLADQVIEIGDSSFVGPDGFVDNGAVQAARLACENRKWLLSKMLPKQFGDKVTAELVGDSDRPLITRIELVPVDPRPIVDVTPAKPRKQRIRKPSGSPG